MTSAAATEMTLKRLDAGLLNVGYAEAGPADGPVVLLLHGWPYDIHSYADVAPMLAAEGYRAIIPYAKKFSCRYSHRTIEGASDTTSPRRRRKPSPGPSSTPTPPKEASRNNVEGLGVMA